MQALVFTVDAAARIIRSDQERRDATERIGERTHERDRSADAHQHRLDTEACVQCATRSIERGTVRIGVPCRRTLVRTERELEAPRDAPFQMFVQLFEGAFWLLSGGQSQAD